VRESAGGTAPEQRPSLLLALSTESRGERKAEGEEKAQVLETEKEETV